MTSVTSVTAKNDTPTSKMTQKRPFLTEKQDEGALDYKVNCVQKLVGREQQLETGDTVRYYSANRTDQNGQKQYAYDVNEISIKSYRDQLVNTMKPILRLLGYDEKKEFSSIDNQIKSMILQQRKIEVKRPSDLTTKISLKNTSKNLKPKSIEKYQLVQIK